MNVKIPGYVTPIFYLKKKKKSELLLQQSATIHLTRKFLFWVFKKFSFTHFEYEESFGQSWVKLPK